MNTESMIIASYCSDLTSSLEDKAFSRDFSELGNAIKAHVQSYYHSGRIFPALIDYDDLEVLGSRLPISTATLSTLLENSSTREIALRFCIAWVVVSKLQEFADHSNSFLPPSIIQCFQQLTNTGHEAQCKFRVCFEYLEAPNSYTADALLAIQWRMVTADLLQSIYIRSPFVSSDDRNSGVRAAAVQALNNILEPFADSRMDNGQRKRDLEELLQRSALFAFALFGRPSCWEFDWKEDEGVNSEELCIFPALMQVTDESGEPVSPPQPFSEAVVRCLSS